jgi:hypothetical protein
VATRSESRVLGAAPRPRTGDSQASRASECPPCFPWAGRFRESPRTPNRGWKRAPGWDPPPMRAEARSRRPASPIPGPPGKERAGEADMREEGREAEAFCGRVESRRQNGTRPRRLGPGQASGSPMDGPGGPPGTMEKEAGPRPIGAGSARCWSDDSPCLCLRLGKDDPPGSPLPQSGASAAVPTGERSSGRPAAGFRPGVQRSGAFRSFGGLGDPAWDPAEWGPSADDPGRRGATGGVIHPAGPEGAPA